LVGSARLASLAEAELRGEPVDDHAVAAEIAPCFVEAGGQRTDTVVLACTHYPLLLDRLTRLAPWPVTYIDPAPAIARRVIDLMGPPTTRADVQPHIIFTSGRAVPAALQTALARMGFAPARIDSPTLST
jgi:glutamate racemase